MSPTKKDVVGPLDLSTVCFGVGGTGLMAGKFCRWDVCLGVERKLLQNIHSPTSLGTFTYVRGFAIYLITHILNIFNCSFTHLFFPFSKYPADFTPTYFSDISSSPLSTITILSLL